MIPDSKKEEVRDAADIVEVVGDYVKLKRSGQAFTGLCPFHNERTPSFNVNPTLGIFKCFGCGEGGDVFSFVMRMDGVGFPEALRTLAERYGIELPESDASDVERADATRNEAVLHALRYAGLYFHRQLVESPEAAPALELLRARGYAMGLIRRFGLGYAPSSGERFLQEAVREGFSEGVLHEADLIKPSTRGDGFYDTFRGRLMFPLFNPSGRVIAFAGRVVDGRKAAKYVNSSQTAVYNKSDVLYGIHFARNEMRRTGEAILVEGYTDVISLHSAGISNAVASAGTALTPSQVRLLKRYAGRLLMIYDADEAGQNAMARGLLIALEEGLDVEMLQLPKGEDPDSFVKASGGEQAGEAFRDYRTRHAADFITFALRKAESRGDLGSLSGVTRLMDEMLEAVSLIPDPVHRQVAVSRLHTLTRPYRGGTDRELFEDVSRRVTDRERRRARRNRHATDSDAPSAGTRYGGAASSGTETKRPQDPARGLPTSPTASGDLTHRDASPAQAALPEHEALPDHPDRTPPLAANGSAGQGRGPAFERALLRLMVEHGEPICRYVGHQIHHAYFEHEPYRTLYEDLMARVSGHQDIDPGVYTAMPPPFPALIADVMMDPHSLGRSNRADAGLSRPDAVQQAKAALKSLKIAYLQRMKRLLSGTISASDMGGGAVEEQERRAALNALTEVQKQLSHLERTPAAACFPDPPGYGESQAAPTRVFDYKPRSRS